MNTCLRCGVEVQEGMRLYCSKRCRKAMAKKRARKRNVKYLDYKCPICGKSGTRKLEHGNKVVTCGDDSCVAAWKRECKRRNNIEYKRRKIVWPSETCSICGGRTHRKIEGVLVCCNCRPPKNQRIRWPANRFEFCIRCGKSKPIHARCLDKSCDEAIRRDREINKQRRRYKIRKNDPWWRMRGCISQQITSAIKRGRIWGKKKKATFEMLGYTPNDLVTHLQNQFEFGMTWNNYGNEWHVDHVRPLSWFKGERDCIRRAWAITNLKPRWANNRIAQQHGGFSEGNAEKSDRYVA